MPPGIQLRNGKRIRCLEDGERTPEDGQATIRVAGINDLPNEVLQMILQPAAIQICLSIRNRTAECLGQVYRRLAICRRWKYLLDDPFFHQKIREAVFQIDSQRKYFRSAKPVSIRGEEIARYGGLMTMDFTTGKIFAYKRSLRNHKSSRIIKVFSFQRRQSKQESWSIRRIGTIPIDRNTLTYIVQMQFTDFNSQLVLLSITINHENIIWFQYQTDAQNPEPEIWRINQSICADWMHSSPSTGKVYLVYLGVQKIDEYGFSDGLHIRTISFNFFKKSDYFFRCIRFHNADDQLHVGIGANKNVATSSPIAASDEQLHLSVRKLRRRPMWFLTCVADKYNNMLLLTNEGASYGLYLAPANRMERIRLLVEIPDSNPNAYGGNHMVFDQGRGLVFLSLAGRKQIYCVRVARMN